MLPSCPKHPQTDQYGKKLKQVKKFRACLHYCTTASRNDSSEMSDSLSQKEPVASPCSSTACLISSGVLDDLIEYRLPWPFWLQGWIFLRVLNGVLLWFSDVPDAPQYLVLSEHKSKSVKLKWIPGDDHNSSTTGTVEEEHRLSHPKFYPPLYFYHILFFIQLHIFLNMRHKIY